MGKASTSGPFPAVACSVRVEFAGLLLMVLNRSRTLSSTDMSHDDAVVMKQGSTARSMSLSSCGEPAIGRPRYHLVVGSPADNTARKNSHLSVGYDADDGILVELHR